MIYPVGWLLISFLTFANVDAPAYRAGRSENGHIQWHFSSVKQSRSEWKLVFTAEVDRGWHLYSQSMEPGGPMPTSFEFEKGDGFRLLGNVMEAGNAKHVYDSTFMMNVVWYEGRVVFTQRVKTKSKVEVAGEIKYSVCSDDKCIPGNMKFILDAGL